MIVLGIILLIIGFVAHIPILWTIGIIVAVIGLILALLGTVGHGASAVATTTERRTRRGCPAGRLRGAASPCVGPARNWHRDNPVKIPVVKDLPHCSVVNPS